MATERFVLVKDKKYRITSYVHAGQFGTVYKAIFPAEGTQREKVAVKIPAPNLNREQLETFYNEYDFMIRLRDNIRGKEKFIPWIEKGTLEEEGKGSTDVLVMEYLPKDKMLGTKLGEHDHDLLEKEEMAIRAAVQYAQLLVALHDLGYTCQDRKTTDLRWIQKGMNEPLDGRLVVLDWNVVHEGTDGESVSKDIFKFGSLWYQLMVGKFPPESPNVYHDELWREGSISYGARYILRKALAASQYERYASASDLLSDLENLSKLYNNSNDELQNMARPPFEGANRSDQEAQRILTQAQQRYDPRQGQEVSRLIAKTLNEGRQALSYFDLAWRKGSTDVETARNDCLKLVMGQPERLLRHLQHAFKVSNYKIGLDVAEWVKQAAGEAGEHGLQLRAARWEALLKAYQDGLKDYFKADFRPQFERLMPLFDEEKEIEAGKWEELAAAIEQILGAPSLPPGAMPPLKNLMYEAKIRAGLQRKDEATRMGEYTRALEITKNARNLLGLLSPDYKDLFFLVFPDITVSDTELEKKARDEGKQTNLRDEVFQAMGNLEAVERLWKYRLSDTKADLERIKTEVNWLDALRSFYISRLRDDWDGGGKEAIRMLEAAPVDWKNATKAELLIYFKLARDMVDKCLLSESGEFISPALKISEALEEVQPYMQAPVPAHSDSQEFVHPSYVHRLNSMDNNDLRQVETAKINDEIYKEIEDLFKGLKIHTNMLKQRQEAREKILEALEKRDENSLQDALDMAKETGLNLLRDPVFSKDVLTHWEKAQQLLQRVQQEVAKKKNDFVEIEEQANENIERLERVANHYQRQIALASADRALRELDLKSLQENLNNASQNIDRKKMPSFEQNWLEKMQADLKWLMEEEEKGLENWQRLESIKKKLQKGEPIPEQAAEILQEHPDSYLISLWKQQDALIRLRQGANNEYLFEREELNKIIARVNDIKAGVGEKPKKISPMDADRLWHLLARLEEHLTDLPIAFFQGNVELTQRIVGALEAIKGLNPHKMWPWASKKEWNRYLGDRIEFLHDFHSQESVVNNLAPENPDSLRWELQ